MFIINLATSDLPYVWPETTMFTVIQALIFIILFILVMLVARVIFLQRKATTTGWTHILNYAYNRNLSSKEIAILENFFNNLDLSVNEKANLLHHKKAFESELYSYLEKFHSDSVEVHVKILDKLFLPRDQSQDFKNLMDINIGEVCALEFDGVYFLARVMNRTFREILLSVQDNTIDKDKEGNPVNLYFYRKNISGYLVPGFLKKIKGSGILFFQEGEFQLKGEEHLVSDYKQDVQLFPWGLNAQDSSLDLHDESNNLETLEEKKSPERESVNANIIKLSDRAVLLIIKDPSFNISVFRKIDIWEMPFTTSNESIPLVLKGKLMKSQIVSDAYVFKFQGLSDSEVMSIFKEIKKNSPVRGYIS